MWHVVKVEYSIQLSAETAIKMQAYGPLSEAQRIFDRLELAYQLDAPLRLRDGSFIKVRAVTMHESLRERVPDALAAVEAGEATLMFEAQGVDFEISG